MITMRETKQEFFEVNAKMAYDASYVMSNKGAVIFMPLCKSPIADLFIAVVVGHLNPNEKDLVEYPIGTVSNIGGPEAGWVKMCYISESRLEIVDCADQPTHILRGNKTRKINQRRKYIRYVERNTSRWEPIDETKRKPFTYETDPDWKDPFVEQELDWRRYGEAKSMRGVY